MTNTHIAINGHMVSERVSRVVEAIRAYDRDLRVEWQPQDVRQEGQPAFKIVYDPPNGDEYILFFVSSEEEFDERVLHRIIANDQRNGETTWDEYSAWEETQKLVQHQEFLDMMEELNDVTAHVLKTKKNTYKVNDDLVIKEGIPFNVAPRRRG